MKRTLALILLALTLVAKAQEDFLSPTEGRLTDKFVPEAEMKADLLQMLANFARYMTDDFQECVQPNSRGEACGCFRGEHTMANDERGVRPNADLGMVCAFLVRYAKPAGIALPDGTTWERLEDMAMKSLVFAYSTHKANRLKPCAGGDYWGSVSVADHTWESSLWAMSVAYSAFFQWDKLDDHQRECIYALLKAECQYELERDIPTGYEGDTKAEENGWEADVLAATLGLFPDDPLATKWFERLREFAVNSYSHPSDADKHNPIDPWYDNTTVADLYRGSNLFPDYTLQNHALFHTSYQNVVMQELGEAALALKLFQTELHGHEQWRTAALMHNNQQVQDSVLNWLALADGELAMPNGNDWSLFLYDQITSYSTAACFLRDPHALMQENMAYKHIKARQQTTPDGSWLLRPDVGARRMGVQAHRVMMTYLMHETLSTHTLKPTRWDAFNHTYGTAKLLPCQNIVRASTDSRFTCFSWSKGLSSYTGYFAANTPDYNKIVVPYRAHNTGNLVGWYEVEGHKTNAKPVVDGIYQLEGNAYVMNGELLTNDGTLNHRFAIYSTPNNAIVYLDHVEALAPVTITAEKGGLLAISTDEFTRLSRTLYYNKERDTTLVHSLLDGNTPFVTESNWINVDNQLGIITSTKGKHRAFGDREANNSIYTAKLYPLYANKARKVEPGETVDTRHVVYYSLLDAASTRTLSTSLTDLSGSLPKGWNGVIAPDRGCDYFIVGNFRGDSTAILSTLTHRGMAPVFRQPTHIHDSASTVTLVAQPNHSIAHALPILVNGSHVVATLVDDDTAALLTATSDTRVSVDIHSPKQNNPAHKSEIAIKKGQTVKVSLNGRHKIKVERNVR